MMFVGTEARISDRAWHDLAEAIRAEPKIMGSRVTAEGLRQMFAEGKAVVGLEDGGIVGFMCAWGARGGLIEIGSIWVRPDLRGIGWGNRIAHEMTRKIQDSRARVFSITTNPACVAALKKAGMVRHADWHSPFPWCVTCGPCDTVPEPAKPGCPIRDAKCVLLVFPDGI